MRRLWNQVVSFMLVLALACTSVPVPVYAEELSAEEAVQEESAADEAAAEETAENAEEEVSEEPAENTVSDDAEQAFFEPLLTYRAIPGEGEYESIREHLSDDMAIVAEMDDVLPEVYDPVAAEAAYLPVNRNQSPYGTCWAHSAMAVAEIGLAKNKGVDASAIDLSELQLAYFMYFSPETDPLGFVVGDKNELVGPKEDFLEIGGNIDLAKKIMQGWISAGKDQGELAYGNAANVLEKVKQDEKGLADGYAFDDIYHLENYYNISIRESQEAKKAIMKYGAITASYYSDSKLYKDNAVGGTSYYYNQGTKTNHAIVIVGWDDHYPKEKFAVEPETDGAWLVRNSWNRPTAALYSMNNYFWLSYCDTSLTGSVAMEFAPAEKYNNNYHYDGAAIERNYTLSSGTKIANVFTAKGEGRHEMLEAVSFETDSSNVIYDVAVYTGLKDMNDPESGTFAGSARGVTSYSGYYTIPLEEPAPLQKGEAFSVVFTLSHADNSGVRVPRETTWKFDWIESVATSKEGESFRKTPTGRWSDIGADTAGNYRIKAFTNNVDTDTEPESLKLDQNSLTMFYGRTERVKAVVSPKNATDKQVTWSSSDDSVVTVSDGLLTATGIGQAVVTAELAQKPGTTVSCIVDVLPSLRLAKVSGLSDWTYGSSMKLSASLTPKEAASDYTLSWSSSDPAVVKVSEDGMISAVGKGTAEVTVYAKEQDLICDSVTVTVSRLADVYTQMTLADDNSGITISWDAVNGADRYRVTLGENTNTTDEPASMETDELTCFFAYPLEEEKSYNYSVIGINSSNALQSAVCFYPFTVKPKHKITYVLNGGTNHPDNPDSLREDTSTWLEDPTRTGYLFKGWYKDASFSEYLDILYDLTEDLTLYAKWEPIIYYVYYDGNGAYGGMPGDQMAYDVEAPLSKVEYYRDGYDFQCWNTERDGSGVSYSDQADILNLADVNGASITLYAIWTLHTYTISYVLDGGKNHAENPVAYSIMDSTICLRAPEKPGCIFGGWYEQESFEGDSVEVLYPYECRDKKLYAKWIPISCQVFFDSNGGSSVHDMCVRSGEVYGDLPVPKRDGYVFSGWYTEKEGGEKVTSDTVMDRLGDHTLYAHWELKYTVEQPKGSIESGTEVTAGTKLYLTTATSGADIYYTLDGTDPIISDTRMLYDDAIIIDRDITLRAAACKAGYNNSSILELTITIKDESDDWGDITEEDKAALEIDSPANIPQAFWVAGISDAEYTGAAITFADLRVFYCKTLLRRNIDFSMKYTDNKKAGTATVTISGKGNYSGKLVRTFRIAPVDISRETGRITVPDITLIENGKVQKASPVLYCQAGGKQIMLKKNVDYTVTYPDTSAGAYSAAGSYPVAVEGMGNYTGSLLLYEKIEKEKKLMSGLSYVVKDSQYHEGGEVFPERLEVKEKSAGKILTGCRVRDAGEAEAYLAELVLPCEYDYLYYCRNNTQAGTAEAVFIGTGNQDGYVGSVTKQYKVKGISIKKLAIDGLAGKYPYTGSEIKPLGEESDGALPAGISVSLKSADKTTYRLIKGKDYTVSYQNNIKAGKATVIVTGINGYTGTQKKTFVIRPYDLKEDTDRRICVNPIADQYYTKGGVKPVDAVIVMDQGRSVQLVYGTDYTLKYSNNAVLYSGAGDKKPTVTIKGRGNYAGSVSAGFQILPGSLERADIMASDIVYREKSNLCKPVITITDTNGSKLKAGTDYVSRISCFYYEDTVVKAAGAEMQRFDGDEVEAADIVPEGTVIRAVVEGKGNYADSTGEAFFRYVATDISKAKVTVAAQTYTGSAIEPTKDDIIKITVNNKALTKSDYEIVGYSNNVAKGTARMTIRGKGSYGGIKTVSFKIVQHSMHCVVKFRANGGSGDMNDISALGGKITLPANAFYKTGAEFTGWNTKADGSGIAYGDGQVIDTTGRAGNVIILYAQWSQ